jgi:hypothetical protein
VAGARTTELLAFSSAGSRRRPFLLLRCRCYRHCGRKMSTWKGRKHLLSSIQSSHSVRSYQHGQLPERLVKQLVCVRCLFDTQPV